MEMPKNQEPVQPARGPRGGGGGGRGRRPDRAIYVPRGRRGAAGTISITNSYGFPEIKPPVHFLYWPVTEI